MAQNIAKTESMVVATKPRLARPCRPQGRGIEVVHNGTMTKAVDRERLLGLLDEQLTWNSHIDEGCSITLKRIYLLKAVKINVPKCEGGLFIRPY